MVNGAKPTMLSQSRSGMPRFDDATLAQIEASDPDASTWVPANAGSGKTRVLIDRVSRLLFRGNDPAKILCLTYTRAAAAEMQNRLFSRLGGWAMMPDDRLRSALLDLGEPEDNLTEDSLRTARRLFANALETPGGLKIQTIHAFCDTLLRRFPLEAGVSAQFEIIDDRHARVMRRNILDVLAARDSTREVVKALLSHISDVELDGFLDEIVGQRDAFELGFPEELGAEPEPLSTMIEQVFTPETNELLAFWVNLLRERGSTMDRRGAEKLARALEMTGTLDGLEMLEGCLLTGGSANEPFSPKYSSFPTKAMREAEPQNHGRLAALMSLVAEARSYRVHLKAYERNRALHDFAECYFAEFDRRKLLGGYLTFDDLIRKTIRLLSSPGIADWILFRLDGGVDHILIDEAQDTSRTQWEIIQCIEAEFTAGESDREHGRTLFVVGDEKQSIFSFQGADPDYFMDMRDHFAMRQARVGRNLAESRLLYSFRSAPPILELTDQVCQQIEMTGNHDPTRHRAFHVDLPGRIDLWPYIEKEKEGQDYAWERPETQGSAKTDVRLELARTLAGYLDELLANPPVLSPGDGGRPLSAGDVLILVQTRSEMFYALIRELKARGLPVAGADRMEVGAELAVRDILSLLRFAATPSDDLALAEALRSPLIGLSEAELFDVANEREGNLWKAVASRRDRFGDACYILADCVEQSHLLRPFDLIERILGRHGGRQRMLARLGPEAEDGIDELVAEALKYEQSGPPTVTGFLNWFELGAVDVKRQTQAGLDQIRVMTVHGAKGLEAPFVVLPDTAKTRRGRGGQTLLLEDGHLLWRSSKGEAIEEQTIADEDREEFQRRERNRLLYVAITRTAQWLLICGAGDSGSERSQGWYSCLETAMNGLGARPVSSPVGNAEGLRLGCDAWPTPPRPIATMEPSSTDGATVPSWLREIAAPDWPDPPAENPSKLGGEKVISTPASSDASPGSGIEFGQIVHTLLEHLPKHPSEEWTGIANRLGASRGWSDFGGAVELTKSILCNPEFEGLFGPGSLAEVPIAALVDQTSGRRIVGTIDRLIVTDDEVLAVDYKTNAEVPESPGDVPDGLLRQMGAYADALERVYPKRDIKTAILWTATGTLMPLG